MTTTPIPMPTARTTTTTRHRIAAATGTCPRRRAGRPSGRGMLMARWEMVLLLQRKRSGGESRVGAPCSTCALAQSPLRDVADSRQKLRSDQWHPTEKWDEISLEGRPSSLTLVDPRRSSKPRRWLSRILSGETHEHASRPRPYLVRAPPRRARRDV